MNNSKIKAIWQLTHQGVRLRVGAILAIGAAALLGCETIPIAIVDLQTDKVVIHAAEDEDAPAIAEKAREGCAIHARIPHYLSERKQCGSTVCYSVGGSMFCGPSDCVMHHLFACVQ